jgi:hypothetical protein
MAMLLFGPNVIKLTGESNIDVDQETKSQITVN